MSRIDLDWFLHKRTPEELNVLVKDILVDRVFLSTQLPNASLIKMVFLPLIAVEFSDQDIERLTTDLGVLYGYLHTSYARCINNMPMLQEVSALNREDWCKVRVILEKEGKRDFTDQLRCGNEEATGTEREGDEHRQ